MPQVIGLAIRAGKKKPMQLLERAKVTRLSGVENDFRGKPGKRQVTVMSHADWLAASDEIDATLDWSIRRANILVDDIALFETTGKLLAIGDLRLLITRETDPCSRMEAAHYGLFNALAKDWRGGVCCKVIADGTIKINDKVRILESNK